MSTPRIVIGLLGIDQHEVGAIAVTALLRDAGMEVIYAGRYNTPETLTRIATEEDADVIGISCHSWEYIQYVPELMQRIALEDMDVAVVLGGSVITATDEAAMRSEGVAAVFGPDVGANQIVSDVRALAQARHSRFQASMGS